MAFPEQLKGYRAWVCWRLEHHGVDAKATKVPYNPVTGMRASTTDPTTWVSYDEAANAVTQGYSGLGFCLHRDFGITGGDLDDPWKRADHSYISEVDHDENANAQQVWASHWQILSGLNTYSEWSPSNRGFRFFLFGLLPEGWGNRAGKVELYSEARFLTVTGNALEQMPATIEHRQGALELLGEAIGLSAKFKGTHASLPATRDDAAIISACMHAATAPKFIPLWAGDITGYGSGSEADQALANFICFQTDNTEQAERVFRSSPHYAARTKLHDRPDLIDRVINNGFDKKPPPVDTSAMLAAHEAVRQQQMAAAVLPPVWTPTLAHEPIPEYPNDALLKPDGMLGEIAQFIYDAAPRPSAEVALAGAIGFLAGLTGRAYNVNGTGLNQYVVLLGHSGVGKEAMSSGIAKMVAEIAPDIEATRRFIGPSEIASPQALYKHFGSSWSFLSQVPEFGVWLLTHTSERASTVERGLVRAVLNLWGKSGRGNEAGKMIYSDKDKNVEALNAPGFSILGESVPDVFYAACTPGAISGGLIPRMLIIEHKGKRPRLNKASFGRRPGWEFTARLKTIVQICLERNNKHDPIDVGYEPNAEHMLDAFNDYCDAQHDGSPHEVVKALWNRTHLKALKLAALKAVGRNWIEPRISVADAEWGKSMALHDAHMLLERMDMGAISTGTIDDDKHRAILKTVQKVMTNPEFMGGFKFPQGYRERGLVPMSLLIQANKTKAFAPTHSRTTQQIMTQAVTELCEIGVLAWVDQSVTMPQGIPFSERAKSVTLIDASVYERMG